MILSLSASAFAQVCEVKLVDNYNRPLRYFRAVGGPNPCQEAMKQCRYHQRVTNSRYYTDCFQMTPDPTPAPIPGPAPRPAPRPEPYPPTPIPEPVPSYTFTAVGLLESVPFKFIGRDPAEVYQSCLLGMPQLRNSAPRIDDILVSANNNSYKKYYNSGYYYTDEQICSIVYNEFRAATYGYVPASRVVGFLERSNFTFDFFDRESLLFNCMSAISNLRIPKSDEIQYSLNGLPYQRISTGGWWYTSAEACSALITNLEANLN